MNETATAEVITAENEPILYEEAGTENISGTECKFENNEKDTACNDLISNTGENENNIPEEETNAHPKKDEDGDIAEDENKDESEPSSSDKDEMNALRAEVAELRRALTESRAMYERMHSECAEFSELYPDVSLSSLPDSVWERVKEGVPISAAYALEERRASLAAEKAARINKDNRGMSSGTLSSAPSEDYFSPSEVRAMTSAEVRANYSKIINSMSKWH